MKLDDLASIPPGTGKRTVVVPFPYEESVLRCLSRVEGQGMADTILVGDGDRIAAVAREHDIAVSVDACVPAGDESEACEKAVSLVLEKRAQVLMKGNVQTASFMKAILHNKDNLLVHGRLMSLVSVFELPSYPKLLLLTDPAVNINPGIERKKQIIVNAIELAHCIGIPRPMVACVEATEKVNPKIRSTVDASKLAELGQQGYLGAACVAGPFGLDVAISPEAAAIKGVSDIVAGHADIIVLPNLVAANALYKSLVWFAGARVANIVAGVKCPVVIASRSDSDEAKFLSLALAVHVASNKPPDQENPGRVKKSRAGH